MPELPPILVAGLTGFLSGFLLSIPIGPINCTIINEGARRGFKWGLLIGLGAAVMDVVYCTLAFTGFSSFFGNKFVKATMELFSFVFMLFLGFKFFLAKSVHPSTALGRATEKLEGRIEEKLHPRSAFFSGLVRVMANPGVLLLWLFVAATLLSRDLVQDSWDSKIACITGVAIGVCLWFTALSWAVSLGQGRFSEKTLLRIERISGLGLIGLGLVQGVKIAWHLARH